MAIIFTKHAQVRMSQRDITEEAIKSVIEEPGTVKESLGKRMVARKKIANRTLEVIYKKSEDKTMVITCYWIKEG